MYRRKRYPRGRTTTSITIDPMNLEMAKGMGLNISQICDKAVAFAIGHPDPEVVHAEKTKTPAELILEAMPIQADKAVALLLKKTPYTEEKIKKFLRERRNVLWKMEKPDYVLKPLDEDKENGHESNSV